MAWKPKTEKILKVLWYTAVVITSAGILGYLRAIEIGFEYWNLPHSPNPSAGNIYPLNIHGYVVYQTLEEQLRRERWEFWSWQVSVFGCGLGVFHKWLTERRKRR